MAVRTLEWPSRAMSSLSVAPDDRAADDRRGGGTLRSLAAAHRLGMPLAMTPLAQNTFLPIIRVPTPGSGSPWLGDDAVLDGGYGAGGERASADCRLRAAVELRAVLPGRPGRFGGVAVPASPRFPERVRGAAGPRRRLVQVRS